jgi:hypothetical protein
MKYRKITLKNAGSFILATFVIFLIFSCATVRHGYLMKGTILDTSDSDVYLCIGSRDGASVGQELDVYAYERYTPPGVKSAPTFKRINTGKLKITEIVDEHYAKAKVISGKAELHATVELLTSR